MTNLQTHDRKILTSHGNIFVRTWSETDGDMGDAVPIVLFHDSLGCVELWREFPEKLALATERPAIAYDRLGYGRSDPHPGKPDLDFIAEEARNVVPLLSEELGFSRFIACGHSVGGGMAVETAARFTEECRAIITMGAQAFIENQTLVGIQRAQKEFARPENLARLEKYHGDKAVWVVEEWINSWLAPEFADWSLDEALALVRCPVLAIHGTEDEYGSTEHATRIAAGRGEVRIFEKTGHNPHREDEHCVLDAINRFLQGK